MKYKNGTDIRNPQLQQERARLALQPLYHPESRRPQAQPLDRPPARPFGAPPRHRHHPLCQVLHPPPGPPHCRGPRRTVTKRKGRGGVNRKAGAGRKRLNAPLPATGRDYIEENEKGTIPVRTARFANDRS